MTTEDHLRETIARLRQRIVDLEASNNRRAELVAKWQRGEPSDMPHSARANERSNDHG